MKTIIVIVLPNSRIGKEVIKDLQLEDVEIRGFVRDPQHERYSYLKDLGVVLFKVI